MMSFIRSWRANITAFPLTHVTVFLAFVIAGIWWSNQSSYYMWASELPADMQCINDTRAEIILCSHNLNESEHLFVDWRH